MDNQIFKNQYALEKMIFWFIIPLEFNLKQFNALEENDSYLKTNFAHTLKKVANCCANLPSQKIIIKGSPRFLHLYTCAEEKWHSWWVPVMLDALNRP